MFMISSSDSRIVWSHLVIIDFLVYFLQNTKFIGDNGLVFSSQYTEEYNKYSITFKRKCNLALHSKYYPKNYYNEKVQARPEKLRCPFPTSTNLSSSRLNVIFIKKLSSPLQTGN